MSVSKLALAAALTVSLGSVAIAQTAPMANYTPVTDKMLADPSPNDWPMFRRTFNGWGYSPLDQINKQNVGNLRMAWSRAMEPGAQEGTPIVHDGIMFLPNAGNVVQALDARNGDLIWEYRRELPADIDKYDGLADVTRTLGLYGNNVILTSADGYVVALDAKTGKVAYEILVADYKTLSTRQSGGPLIANGKIFSGRRCSPKGGPKACFVSAHSAQNGEELWRFYTIPQPGEPGFDTWGDTPYESRLHLGSWMVPTYDPETNLVFFGTSTTAPYSKFHLNDPVKKDWEYLYQSSTLALNADSGKITWYVQHLRDHWDLDNVFVRLLVDTAVTPNKDEVKWINPSLKPGEKRKVMTGTPGKTATIHTMDRQTGELLWVRETVPQNVYKDFDWKTGRGITNPDILFTQLRQEFTICPGIYGGKDWQEGSYSPRTNMMYYPLQNSCSVETNVIANPTAADGAAMRHRTIMLPDAKNAGNVFAINAETGKQGWKFENRAGMWSTVATGGGLVIAGDLNRRLRVFDDETGKVLFETILAAPAAGFPVTYAVDGKQYVAVPVGSPGVTGRQILSVTPELKPGTGGNSLFVFALP